MEKKDNMPSFNVVQQKAVDLMRADLRFLYTMLVNQHQLKSNYVVSSMPYIGLVVDGIEDWINRYNNSSKTPLSLPVFSNIEREYYEEMRNAIKMWDLQYDEIYNRIKDLYERSETHFAKQCHPLARELKLYDIYGVDIVNGEICGNTIMCAYYVPAFSFEEKCGEFIKEMATIAGKYIRLFDAQKAYSVNAEMQFMTKDYGGFIKSPLGHEFNDNFILFSLLGQIQYLLICVDSYIIEECSTKLRFEYILYYYLVAIIPSINERLNVSLTIDTQYHSALFRNAMAHYSLGVALKPSEIIGSDPLGGLTQKYFDCDYNFLKNYITEHLNMLAKQIKSILLMI